MNINYKRSVVSPLQRTSPPEVRREHPVHQVMKQFTGTYQLLAHVEQDEQTMHLLRHMPGVVAYLATITRDGKVIGQGRGSAVFTRVNRYIERTVRSAFNSALISAMMHTTKSLDALGAPQVAEADRKALDAYKENEVPEGITERQRGYLSELVNSNVLNERERDNWMSQLQDMTKEEASAAIQSFVK